MLFFYEYFIQTSEVNKFRHFLQSLCCSMAASSTTSRTTEALNSRMVVTLFVCARVGGTCPAFPGVTFYRQGALLVGKFQIPTILAAKSWFAAFLETPNQNMWMVSRLSPSSFVPRSKDESFGLDQKKL